VRMLPCAQDGAQKQVNAIAASKQPRSENGFLIGSLLGLVKANRTPRQPETMDCGGAEAPQVYTLSLRITG
jgi:hypothetical protein